MLHTILCGHTGSNNRGCEAIVRSTLDLLQQQGVSADIATINVSEDRQAGLEKLGRLIPYYDYQGRMSLRRVYNGVMKKVFHNDGPYQAYCQRDVFAAVRKTGSSLVIGGDTYCYGRSSRLTAYALNRFSEKRKYINVLWSCSVDAEKIDAEMIADLQRYTKIFPREQLTYRNLVEAGIPEEKLYLMSDSAFALTPEMVELPEDFDNVLAYNPSYTLGVKVNREMLFEARVTLLRHLLEYTNLKVALIPHVYREDFGDLVTCRALAEAVGDTNRVIVIDGNYNCCQLKYIISKCRFLIAERTHASIAGYSQLVPTFVIGYSVKSRGIATDLFGTDEGAVIPSHIVNDDQALIAPVMRFLENEQAMRQCLKEVVPAYIDKTKAAVTTLTRLIAER